MRRTNPDFLNGVPELLVLRLLTRRARYGYELVQAIRAATQEKLAFGEGCIYPHLHYLERGKLVTSRRQEVDGRSRVYYRITPRGRRRLAALAQDWNRVVSGVALALDSVHP